MVYKPRRGTKPLPPSRLHTVLPWPSLLPCLCTLACAHGHWPDIHGREARLVEGLVGRNRVGLCEPVHPKDVQASTRQVTVGQVQEGRVLNQLHGARTHTTAFVSQSKTVKSEQCNRMGSRG